MGTERETLHKIMRNEPDGLPALFDRHGLLFREGLIRFFKGAGEDRLDQLAQMAQAIADGLRADEFDDLHETFYDWVMRKCWCTFMNLRIQEEGGEHTAPETIYACADALNKDALDDEVRQAAEAHFEACDLCRDLLENTVDIPVEIRHAGAVIPDEFKIVITKVLKRVH